MNNTQLTTTDLGDFSVAITTSAEQAKSDALALAVSIKVVTGPVEQQDAVAAASILKSLIKGMETTRVDVKEPALAACRLIDNTAKGYSAPLMAEAARIEALASRYQAEVDKAAQAVREAEEARQARVLEAMEEERLAQLAESRRRETEADAARLRDLEAIQAASDEAARELARKAADDAAEQRARDAATQQAHEQEIAESRLEEMRLMAGRTAMVAATPKVEGASVRREMDFEVIDIAAVYLVRPDLVRLEIQRALTKAAVNLPGAGLIAGLRVFAVTKLVVK